jgi:hypothetical protein
MTTDPTETARRELMPTMPAELQAELDAGRPIWTTDELQRDFNVEGFSAPFVIVRRKADNVRGSLMFTHSPRHYFGWAPA